MTTEDRAAANERYASEQEKSEDTKRDKLFKFSQRAFKKLTTKFFPSKSGSLNPITDDDSAEKLNVEPNLLFSFAARNPRYASMMLLAVLYVALALVVRFNWDGYYLPADIEQKIWYPPAWSQQFFAVLVLLAPILLAITGSQFRARFEEFINKNKISTRFNFHDLKVKKREPFSPDIYGTVVGVRLLIEYLIFSLTMYLLVSALAWKKIETTHHWIWSDRQTVGFVFTILLSIFAALFSNSLRDLFQRNNEIKEQIEETVIKTRHLLDELTEISDRLWSEFEVEFKVDGKVFMYRANQYINQSGPNTIAPLISGLVRAAQMSRDSLQDDNSPDRLSEEISEFDSAWKENGLDGIGGVLRRDQSRKSGRLRLEPWSLTIRPSDISNSEGVVQEEVEAVHEVIKDSTFRTTTSDIRSSLIDIAQCLTDPDDGRFLVIGNLDEESKNRLAIQRRYKSLVALVETTRDKKSKCWGFFPTDESVTYSIMNLMMQDKSWLNSDAGMGFREWLMNVYKNLFIFHRRNEERFEKMNELLNKVSLLLDDQGIPSALLLDDLYLFGELLRTGSDSRFTNGQVLNEQQLKTTARIITYAASFYAAMVWNAGPDRALLPTFPSPFAGLVDELLSGDGQGQLVMHPATRLYRLEQAVNRALQDVVIDNDFEGPAWSVALELSHRQGPLTNWMRSARAYRSREDFLYSQKYHAEKVNLISKVPDSRNELMGIFFPSATTEVSEKLGHKSHDRAGRLMELNEKGNGFFRLRGPRTLKVQRKSGIKSLLIRGSHV